jgi:hypothetical protein
VDRELPAHATETAAGGKEPPAQPVRLVVAALVLGVAFDVLFHGHGLGINFAIWAALSAAALLASAHWEATRPDRSALLIVPAILFFSAIVAIRLEPMTVALSLLSTLLLFGLWIRTLTEGRLLRFGWLDFGLTWIRVPIELVLRPWPTLGVATRDLAGDRAARSRGAAVLRGLLLALPALIVLVALLAAADLVFQELVEDLLAWLDIEWIREALGRAMLISVAGLLSLGALVTARRRRDPGELISERQPLLRPFLGFIETTVVLGAVDLVFGVFVVIQFRYLFGGEANITAAGYTYSEYARRGFGELVWAAFLSSGLILALAQLGSRERGRQQAGFHALSVGLIAMLGVTLASALMRLLLYENAYGFTRLRTYTHVFILWLAALLAAFLAVLLRGRLRTLAPATVAAGFGFVATLGLLNLDGFITSRNLARMEAGGELDLAYLGQLTGDALPVLVDGLGDHPAPEVLAVLACQAKLRTGAQADPSWQAWHWGRRQAAEALKRVQVRLVRYAVDREDGVWMVAGPGVPATPCHGQWLD